ncbi:MAG: methyltransferase regulatory domain-containing protein [Verrucomicrobia bacterium]|nr:methyltransferase regulatory domain-containing protein [Verrucomicrobiota bacterium]
MNGTETLPNLYDEVLYPAAVHVHTAPDRLATVAVLRGMRPAPVDHCRVLEIGCGEGTNLISMAFNYPESNFLGIDLAGGPVLAGQQSIAELGFKNISLQPLDLCSANRERFGFFDYIIAHGLYSWVPQPVRQNILALCRDMLAPQGIAYISYNAYPGNHLRELSRGIVRFHTAHLKQPLEKIQQARGILQFLANSTPTEDAYIKVLKSEFERVVKYRDEAFFHDDLSETNQAFYFHEFMRDAGRHGLQFLGESSPNEVDPGKVTAEVLSELDALQGSAEIVREQYKDFVRGCGFRRTLLCHQEVRLTPARVPEKIKELHLSCDALPVQSNGNGASSLTLFRRPDGGEIETEHPLIAAALKVICSEWPCTIPFSVAIDRAKSSLSGNLAASPLDNDATAPEEALLKAYESGFLQLHVLPRLVVNRVNKHPVSSGLARFQLKRGSFATSQLHKFVRLEDPVSRRLVQLLDGSRDIESVLRALILSIRSDSVELCENGLPLTDPERISDAVERGFPQVMRGLVREGLLVG